MAGRYAPSPSGPLHVGNLRTALAAWLTARAAKQRFLVRIEDLDPVTSTPEHAASQLADLSALGLDWDGDVVRQSDRLGLYRDVIAQLERDGAVYPCFCSRREIREQIERSSRAPHAAQPDGAYPGTCRDLSSEQVAEQRERRPAAWRLRTDGRSIEFVDRIAGEYRGAVDDVVLARADGIPAYNLAVVVDDHLQGVTQVVRGDDLLSSTPRQLLLYELCGWEPPEFWHVPLVMDGTVRLAKRSGGVTLAELERDGWSTADVLARLAHSLGLAASGEPVSLERLVQRFEPELIRRDPVQVTTMFAAGPATRSSSSGRDGGDRDAQP